MPKPGQSRAPVRVRIGTQVSLLAVLVLCCLQAICCAQQSGADRYTRLVGDLSARRDALSSGTIELTEYRLTVSSAEYADIKARFLSTAKIPPAVMSERRGLETDYAVSYDLASQRMRMDLRLSAETVVRAQEELGDAAVVTGGIPIPVRAEEIFLMDSDEVTHYLPEIERKRVDRLSVIANRPQPAKLDFTLHDWRASLVVGERPVIARETDSEVVYQLGSGSTVNHTLSKLPTLAPAGLQLINEQGVLKIDIVSLAQANPAYEGRATVTQTWEGKRRGATKSDDWHVTAFNVHRWTVLSGPIEHPANSDEYAVYDVRHGLNVQVPEKHSVTAPQVTAVPETKARGIGFWVLLGNVVLLAGVALYYCFLNSAKPSAASEHNQSGSQ